MYVPIPTSPQVTFARRVNRQPALARAMGRADFTQLTLEDIENASMFWGMDVEGMQPDDFFDAELAD